jgi:putative ABC transport system permease protein
VISFAFKTLVGDRGKLLTGMAGVVFALVLVNVQGGLYLGLMRKASVLVDRCDADLWVCHREIENVDLARSIPEIWRNRLRGVPGVANVEPYIVGKGTATLPGGRMEDVWIIGSDPTSMLGSGWRFSAGGREDLKRPDGISFDEVDSAKLGNPNLGDWLEVNGRRAHLVARTSGITGFITMPYLFTTIDTARALSHVPAESASYLLVQIDEGGDVGRVLSAVRRRVPDAAVYLPEDLAHMSQDYWMKRTGIGISFGASTALGLLVGLVVVGQSLLALALDHRDDYATLKALGAKDRQVCGIIVIQALTIAAAGSVLGSLAVAAIGCSWNSALAPVAITPALFAASVALVFVICLAASLLPFLRIRRIDPAVVLMG